MNFEGGKGTENVEKVSKLELGIRIMEIGHNPDSRTYPVVGYFPSGYDPLKNSDDPGSDLKSNPSVRVHRSVNSRNPRNPESNPSVKVHRSVNSRNPRNPRMPVVVGASGFLEKVGTDISGESMTPQLSNDALGVLDKETGVSSNRDEKQNALLHVFFDPPMRESNQFLRVNQFLRDKKREALLRIFGDPMEKLKPEKTNTEAVEASSTATERNIPPHDVEATSPDMAYPLDKIIFKGDWKYLEDIFELVEAGSDVSPNVHPTFVCNRAHKIGAIKDEKKRKTMAGILSYITHLIKYKDRHSLVGVSTTSHHKLPSILAQRFSSLFWETQLKNIPAEKQLLLISYVLVLSLFADDFRSDPSDIAKDLRMSPSSLRAHYELLGCKFSKEKVAVATLSAPLEFPTRKRRNEFWIGPGENDEEKM